MSYDQILHDRFKKIIIMLVRHDTGYGGMPAYIEAHLGETPKDKGMTVLDLGNYIYRKFGVSYQNCPEYRGNGKNTTLRWFMRWSDLKPLQKQICDIFDSKVLGDDWLPIAFYEIPFQTGEFQQVALWKKQNQLCLYTQKKSGLEIEFWVGKKKFVYLQAEIGPISDFEILGDL